ncbi:MAG: HD-GYP domain-containing protein [Actinomycetota bacterium]|nr:HD-GYP domain-containing protein [Actinomycetota bacterium]
MPSRYKIKVIVLAVASAAVLASYHWPSTDLSQWHLIALLVVLTFVAENLAFDLPVLGSVSLAFAFDYAALVYAGPIAAAIVVVAGTVTLRELKQKKPVWVVAFNFFQLLLSILLAGIVYLELGGIPLSLAKGLQSASSSVLPMMASAATFFALNVLIVSLGIALYRSLSLKDVWHLQHTANYLVSFVGLALLGALMAQLIAAAGWMGIVLLLLPLVVARQTFQVYQDLARAYSETIRSLVAAIEAKDPYTRGHSERVAGYSCLIGEAVSLAASEVKTLEFAALLHDLGKIGVRTETLVKQEHLTHEEFTQIRRHPEVGKAVLEEVEFLEGIVSIVFAHHERPDGTGYPLGLVSDEIPFEARILAVADCFDAMTSNRAYRRPMTMGQARAELIRVSGTQLDANLVEVFLSQIVDEVDIETLAERMGAAIAQPN